MKKSLSAWVLAWCVGCGATPTKPPAIAPIISSDDIEAATPQLNPPEISEAPPPPASDALPSGMLVVVKDDTHALVRPATIDIAALPMAEIPPPLAYTDAPNTLPVSLSVPAIQTMEVDGRRKSLQSKRSVYLVHKKKLARMQVGHISTERSASNRLYRACGEPHHKNARLRPARWETIEEARGELVYRVVDAWFDAKTCDAAVVRNTVIHPQALVGGLVLAYRSKCVDCPSPQTVTFLTPTLSGVSAQGLGGDAAIGRGAFSIVTLPLRRGGAASFTGMVRAHSFGEWPTGGANYDAPAILGVDITHAVTDDAPSAIAYATFGI